ncbi:MAG: Ger(x)C family spore germination protein [Bacilli bacterium]|nr:Ger(x)C family spore germination protein [Bacilli bacterium]
MKKFLLIIPIIFIFCGCTDYKELNNIAIVTGIAVDMKDDEYEVSVLISNSKKAEESAKEGDAGTIVYDGTGKNISMALKKIDNRIPKQIYLGHLAVVIVSEEVAKKGLDNVSDYLFRSPETTKRAYLIMTREEEKASDVLKIISPLESFPSQNIKLNIENANNTSSISDDMTYSRFMENYLKKGIEPYLPTIKIYGSEKKGSSSKSLESTELKAFVGLKGLALFKDSKFVSYTTDDESRGINIATGNTSEMIIENDCEDGYIITALSNLKTKSKVEFIDDEPTINLSVKAEGAIQGITCDINLYDEKNIEEIEKKTEKKVKKLINKGIDVAQKYKTDVFGFGNLVYKKNPKYFKSIDDWNEKFSTLKIKINVDVNVRTKGSIKQSLKAAENNE